MPALCRERVRAAGGRTGPGSARPLYESGACANKTRTPAIDGARVSRAGYPRLGRPATHGEEPRSDVAPSANVVLLHDAKTTAALLSTSCSEVVRRPSRAHPIARMRRRTRGARLRFRAIRTRLPPAMRRGPSRRTSTAPDASPVDSGSSGFVRACPRLVQGPRGPGPRAAASGADPFPAKGRHARTKPELPPPPPPRPCASAWAVSRTSSRRRGACRRRLPRWRAREPARAPDVATTRAPRLPRTGPRPCR